MAAQFIIKHLSSSFNTQSHLCTKLNHGIGMTKYCSITTTPTLLTTSQIIHQDYHIDFLHELQHNKMTWEPSKASDQPAQLQSDQSPLSTLRTFGSLDILKPTEKILIRYLPRLSLCWMHRSICWFCLLQLKFSYLSCRMTKPMELGSK